MFTDGKPITLGSGDLAVAFGKIGGGSILGIPTPAIIMILVFLICDYILHQTKIGRHTYALVEMKKQLSYQDLILIK